MPLLLSPIDGSPMKQVSRYGIEIDVCPTSGGIWLDKGELEKLMAFIQEQAAGEQSNRPRSDRNRSVRDDSWRDDSEDDEDSVGGSRFFGGSRRDQRDGRGGRDENEGPFARIMDIFEF